MVEVNISNPNSPSNLNSTDLWLAATPGVARARPSLATLRSSPRTRVCLFIPRVTLAPLLLAVSAGSVGEVQLKAYSKKESNNRGAGIILLLFFALFLFYCYFILCFCFFSLFILFFAIFFCSLSPFTPLLLFISFLPLTSVLLLSPNPNSNLRSPSVSSSPFSRSHRSSPPFTFTNLFGYSQR